MSADLNNWDGKCTKYLLNPQSIKPTGKETQTYRGGHRYKLLKLLRFYTFDAVPGAAGRMFKDETKLVLAQVHADDVLGRAASVERIRKGWLVSRQCGDFGSG